MKTIALLILAFILSTTTVTAQRVIQDDLYGFSTSKKKKKNSSPKAQSNKEESKDDDGFMDSYYIGMFEDILTGKEIIEEGVELEQEKVIQNTENITINITPIWTVSPYNYSMGMGFGFGMGLGFYSMPYGNSSWFSWSWNTFRNSYYNSWYNPWSNPWYNPWYGPGASWYNHHHHHNHHNHSIYAKNRGNYVNSNTVRRSGSDRIYNTNRYSSSINKYSKRLAVDNVVRTSRPNTTIATRPSRPSSGNTTIATRPSRPSSGNTINTGNSINKKYTNPIRNNSGTTSVSKSTNTGTRTTRSTGTGTNSGRRR